MFNFFNREYEIPSMSKDEDKSDDSKFIPLSIYLNDEKLIIEIKTRNGVTLGVNLNVAAAEDLVDELQALIPVMRKRVEQRDKTL